MPPLNAPPRRQPPALQRPGGSSRPAPVAADIGKPPATSPAAPSRSEKDRAMRAVPRAAWSREEVAGSEALPPAARVTDKDADRVAARATVRAAERVGGAAAESCGDRMPAAGGSGFAPAAALAPRPQAAPQAEAERTASSGLPAMESQGQDFSNRPAAPSPFSAVTRPAFQDLPGRASLFGAAAAPAEPAAGDLTDRALPDPGAVPVAPAVDAKPGGWRPALAAASGFADAQAGAAQPAALAALAPPARPAHPAAQVVPGLANQPGPAAPRHLTAPHVQIGLADPDAAAPRRLLGRPRAPGAPPRDPAPSRTAYRMQRLWLTPVFRAVLRVGLPAFAAVLATGLWFSEPDRRLAFADSFSEIKRGVQERPEFMVRHLVIDGAQPEVAEAVRAMMPVNLPVSSFDLDLEALRATIATIDAVAGAEVRVRPGGILQIDVSERVPVAIWQISGRLELIDAGGHRVATLTDRGLRPDLPVIAGTGAERAVAEAQALLVAAAPIIGRVRGLVRIGERRWDLVLDRDQRIMLPEADAVRALERALALNAAEQMLERDISAVDLRNAERPTIRLAEDALAEMRGEATATTLRDNPTEAP